MHFDSSVLRGGTSRIGRVSPGIKYTPVRLPASFLHRFGPENTGKSSTLHPQQKDVHLILPFEVVHLRKREKRREVKYNLTTTY